MKGNARILASLVRDLQKAHAGEIAAYLAYGGHAASLTGRSRAKLLRIQRDELIHGAETRWMLSTLGYRPSFARNALMVAVGRVASALSRVTGYRAPMLGALLIESIGKVNYLKMAEKADTLDLPKTAACFRRMAATEAEHERYFRRKIK